MIKRTHAQIIRDVLAYCTEPKNYKDFQTFEFIQNSKTNRKIVRGLINSGYITKLDRKYFLSTDGTVLLTLMRKFLVEFDKL